MGNSVNYKHEFLQILDNKPPYDDSPDAFEFSQVQEILVASAIYGVLRIEGMSEYKSDCKELILPVTKALTFILSSDPTFFPDGTDIRNKTNQDDIRLFVSILLDVVMGYELKTTKSRWVNFQYYNNSMARRKEPITTIRQVDNSDSSIIKIRNNTDSFLRKYGWCTTDTRKEPWIEECNSDPDWLKYREPQFQDIRDGTKQVFNTWINDIYKKVQHSRTAVALKL